jgi:thiol-disulfide isomerase/thioredoxin
MPMTRRFLAWAAIAVAAIAAAGLGAYFGQRAAGTAAPNAAAAALLAISLPDPAGKQESLGQWKGKVLVVNFWATWCGPCREEMPAFVRAQTEHGSKGLQFVGIAVDQPDKVREFAQEIGLNYPALIGGYGAMELSRTLGNSVMALPFTVVVDRNGRIVHTQLGPLREQKLQSIVGELL